MSEDLWNGATPGRQQCPGEHYDPQYRTSLKNAIDDATNLGMYVIVTLNFTNPGCLYSSNSNESGGAALPLPGPGALTFWQDIASPSSASDPYGEGANPLVGFELYDEPHVCPGPGTQLVDAQDHPCSSRPWINDEPNATAWAEGGSVSYAGTSYQGEGMETLYETVRPLTNDLIFLDSNSYAEDPHIFDTNAFVGTQMALDPNLVYAEHMYPRCDSTDTTVCPPAGSGATSTTAQEACTASAATVSNPECPYEQQPGADSCPEVQSDVDWANYWAEQAVTRPIFWTEMGWPYPNDAPNKGASPGQMDYMVDYLDAVGQSWTAFSWTQSNPSSYNSQWALLQSETSPTTQPPSAIPTATGSAVKDAAAGVYHGTCSPVAPSDVTAIDATPQDGQVSLDWNPPDNATSDAPNYTISVTPPGGPTTTMATRCLGVNPPDTTACDTPLIIPNLIDGTTYVISISATNSYGTTTSPSIEVTPAVSPPTGATVQRGNQAPNAWSCTPIDGSTGSPPTGGSASPYNPQDPTITVTWTPSQNVTPIQHYQIQTQEELYASGTWGIYPHPSSSACSVGGDVTALVVHFPVGTTVNSFRFLVIAVDGSGTSSSPAVTGSAQPA